MSPFNFSKDKTLAILASSKLISFVSFTCFELLGVDVQLSGLKRFRLLFCFFAVSCLRSLLLLSMMLCRQLSPRPFVASQCSDPQNQHNICANYDQLLILVPHKYLLKLSSCPLQFSLFSQREKGQFLQHNREKVHGLRLIEFSFYHFLRGVLRCFKGFISDVISLFFPLSWSVFSWRLKLEFSFVFFRDFKSFPFAK